MRGDNDQLLKLVNKPLCFQYYQISVASNNAQIVVVAQHFIKLFVSHDAAYCTCYVLQFIDLNRENLLLLSKHCDYLKKIMQNKDK